MLHRVYDLDTTLQDSTSNNDLTVRAKDNGSDEISNIASRVNQYILWLKEFISEMAQVSIALNQHMTDFKTRAHDSQVASSDLQHKTQSIASSIVEMTESIGEVSKSCEEAATMSNSAKTSSESSKVLVADTARSVRNLGSALEETDSIASELYENTQSIGSILDTIREVADQTNLLALNAAIEAARAGEQGRGFAVVADEVRNLAQRTQESTNEIQHMIESLQTSAEQASSNVQNSQQIAQECIDITDKTLTSIEETNNSIHSVDDSLIHISTAAKQQSAAAQEVSLNVERVKINSDEACERADSFERSSNQISLMFNELSKKISVFKISDHAEGKEVISKFNEPDLF